MLSSLLLALHLLLWMESLFYLPVAVSVTIVVSYPLYNLVIDKLLFREGVRVVQVVGLFTGFTGIVLFMHPHILVNYSFYGVLLALFGSIATLAI